MTKEMRPQFLGQSYQGSKKDLPAMTMVMSVRSHPSITNGEIYAALFEEELPFIPLVSRRRPPSTGDLLVHARTPTVEAAHSYHLRSRTAKEQ